MTCPIPARQIRVSRARVMLSSLAPSSTNESCSPEFRRLVPACAPRCSVTVLAHPVFESLTLQSPPFLEAGDLEPGDLCMPCYERNPGTRPGLSEPLQTSLPAVAKREQRGLAS